VFHYYTSSVVCVYVCLCVPAAVICSSGFSTASCVRGGYNNKEAVYCYTCSVVCLCPTQVAWSACLSVCVYLLRSDALQNAIHNPLHHVCLVDTSPRLVHIQLIILHHNHNETYHTVPILLATQKYRDISRSPECLQCFDAVDWVAGRASGL